MGMPQALRAKWHQLEQAESVAFWHIRDVCRRAGLARWRTEGVGQEKPTLTRRRRFHIKATHCSAGPVAIMASKKSVNLENLAALGAERLASILMDFAEHDPETKRRLRLELAGQAGGAIITAEISKRLTSFKSARSFIDWHKRRDFVEDLHLQRTMIRDRVAPTRPDLALDLMWRFLDLAEPVLTRVDDSNGTVGDVFRAACDDLGVIASFAKPDPAQLAERVFTAVTRNDYGVLDNLVRVICPALGETGVAQLKARLTAAQAKRPATDRHDGQSYALRAALQDIADAEGNVDAYIALVPALARQQPGIAAEIGQRLLKAGRAQEALAALEPAAPKRCGSYLNDDLYYPGYEGSWPEWEDAYLEALDATGQRERAQQIRWAAFEERLSVTRLRAYLKALPDFDDVLAEDKAMAYALAFPGFTSALHFFIEWPNLAHAARLILSRPGEIDGNVYALLSGAARKLEGAHPLAATLLRRAMVEDTHEGAKSKRYRHAARHLMEVDALAPAIEDYAGFETNEAFQQRLKARHARKSAFWAFLVELTR